MDTRVRLLLSEENPFNCLGVACYMIYNVQSKHPLLSSVPGFVKESFCTMDGCDFEIRLMNIYRLDEARIFVRRLSSFVQLSIEVCISREVATMQPRLEILFAMLGIRRVHNTCASVHADLAQIISDALTFSCVN